MRIIATSLIAACAAASLASAQTAAPTKSAIVARMSALAGEIDSLRARGATAREIDARLAEYERLVAALGGGDPIGAERARASAAPVSLARAVTPAPPGSTPATASFTASPALAIPDLGTVSDSIAVSGVGAYLWDVDLTTHITHTWCGDLDIHLTAPSGSRVTISTDVAEGYSNCFAGTLWDDSAPNAAYAYPHVDNATSTPLNPEGKLHRLAGENPTGFWTLSITDDAGADVGVLHWWSLDVTTLSAPPVAPPAPVTLVSTPALAIDGSAPHTDSIAAGGLGTSIAEVRVRLEVPHTWSSDLVVDLTAPTGEVIRLTTLNGSDHDDVFDGTDFFDAASQVAPAVDPLRDQPVDEYPFADLVPAIQVDPEGALTRLIGADPNGTWTLRIVDTYPAADDGLLERWELEISTFLSAAAPYCAPIGPTAGGCTPMISATENPNVAHTNACVITVSGVDGDKSAILFYGVTGTNAAPWCGPGNGNSFMCVGAPTQRTGALNSGGTSGACDGALVRDWNEYQLSHPGTTGQPWSAGDQAWVQGWFRSPTDCKTTFLSQAIELTYQP